MKPILHEWDALKKQGGYQRLLAVVNGNEMGFYREDALIAGKILGRPIEDSRGVDFCSVPYHTFHDTAERLAAANQGFALCEVIKGERKITERHDPEPSQVKSAQWLAECEEMERTNPELKKFLDVWGANCGAPRDVFRGHLCRLLISFRVGASRIEPELEAEDVEIPFE